MAIFRISGSELIIPSGIIVDADIGIAAKISVEKMRHLYLKGTNFQKDIAGTPTDLEEIVWIADNAGTIRAFNALLNVTGTVTDIDFDLKVNGNSILTVFTNVSNTDANGAVINGLIQIDAFATGDIISISMAITTFTGAQGPFAWVELEEAAA